MPKGGRLVIESRNVTVTAAEATRLDLAPGDYVRVNVVDSGAGMAPEVLRRAFKPFFTTKDVGEGMGLGLSICYRIIQECDGRISVKTESGKYCEFTLEFPIKG